MIRKSDARWTARRQGTLDGHANAGETKVSPFNALRWTICATALTAFPIITACSARSIGVSSIESLSGHEVRAYQQVYQNAAQSSLGRVVKSQTRGGSNLTELPVLFVTDNQTGQVEILKPPKWMDVGGIGDGIDGPVGDWVDQSGNLYVSNAGGQDVQEYAPGRKLPAFTYNAGLVEPTAVTTDNRGYLYVADHENGNNGFLDIYGQGNNTLLQQCNIPGSPEGITVDEFGNVFVAYVNLQTGGGNVEKIDQPIFFHSCNGKVLGVSTRGYPGGILMDREHRLLICDQKANNIAISGPPYNVISRELAGAFVDPAAISFNKRGDRLFVADMGKYKSGVLVDSNVKILTYPSGTVIAKLSRANGLIQPAGVAAEFELP